MTSAPSWCARRGLTWDSRPATARHRRATCPTVGAVWRNWEHCGPYASASWLCAPCLLSSGAPGSASPHRAHACGRLIRGRLRANRKRAPHASRELTCGAVLLPPASTRLTSQSRACPVRSRVRPLLPRPALHRPVAEWPQSPSRCRTMNLRIKRGKTARGRLRGQDVGRSWSFYACSTADVISRRITWLTPWPPWADVGGRCGGSGGACREWLRAVPSHR